MSERIEVIFYVDSVHPYYRCSKEWMVLAAMLPDPDCY